MTNFVCMYVFGRVEASLTRMSFKIRLHSMETSISHTCHTFHAPSDLLRQIFDDRLISRNDDNWRPGSYNLTALEKELIKKSIMPTNQRQLNI